MANPASSTAPQAQPQQWSHILFRERDGIYWLRGQDLERAKGLLGLRCDGQAVGFEPLTWSAQLGELFAKGITVGVMHGDTVRIIDGRAFRQRVKRPPLRGTPMLLTPVQLFARAELAQWERRQARNRDRRHDVVSAGAATLADGGTLYVYQVGDDIYEVDWELTTVTQSSVEALAIAAHWAGERLRCQLVPPRAQREAKPRRVRVEPVVPAELLPLGQLRLPL